MASKGKVKGGKKLNAFLKKAKAAKGVKEVEMGFYSEDSYPDGQTLPRVAASHEFGTKNLPERPFFRLAIASMPGQLLQVLKREVDPKTMVVSYSTASRLGQVGVDQIEGSAKRLDVKDTGFLSSHARYKVQ